jgi:hypothetical protein
MYGARYLNVSHVYYLDFAISMLEYRKCYGANATAAGNLRYPIGREKTIGSSQEEYMAWYVNHNTTQITFPKANATNNNSVNTTGHLIETDFVGGYPYTQEILNHNTRFTELFNMNAREIEYRSNTSPTGPTVIGTQSTNGAMRFLLGPYGVNNNPQPQKIIKLSTFYINDVYVVRTIS